MLSVMLVRPRILPHTVCKFYLAQTWMSSQVSSSSRLIPEQQGCNVFLTFERLVLFRARGECNATEAIEVERAVDIHTRIIFFKQYHRCSVILGQYVYCVVSPHKKDQGNNHQECREGDQAYPGI